MAKDMTPVLATILSASKPIPHRTKTQRSRVLARSFQTRLQALASVRREASAQGLDQAQALVLASVRGRPLALGLVQALVPALVLAPALVLSPARELDLVRYRVTV